MARLRQQLDVSAADSDLLKTLGLLRGGEYMNAVALYAAMSPQRIYGRGELDALVGFEKTTTIRLLASLAEKGLVEVTGAGRGRRYRRR